MSISDLSPGDLNELNDFSLLQKLEALPKGPDYIDQNSCRCSLQAVNVQQSDQGNRLIQEAWRCTANQTNNAYSGASGVWFIPQNITLDGLDFAQYQNWSGKPPETDTSYFLQGPDNRNNGSFIPLSNSNSGNQSSADLGCNGLNDTDASSRAYKEFANGLTQNYTQVHTSCYIDSALHPLAVDLGNQSLFVQTGCPLGFQCQNASSVIIPQSCPPFDAVAQARLAGEVVPQAMGYFEPVLCTAGSYCPPGGKMQIPCPAGSFCPLGSYQPQQCSPGATCGTGSYYNQSFLPLALLIVVDVIILVIMLVYKVRTYFKTRKASSKPPPPKKGGFIKRTGTLIGDMAKRSQYQSLNDEDYPLESRITSFQRSNTGFMAVMEPNFVLDENFAMDDKPSSELQLFVQSLSKCMDTTKIGLSFEFENLEFKPRKADKYILQEVTGKIPRGSFCAVMGGSGAGKSTFVNVLMGKQAHTGGVTKVNGLPSKISKYKKIIGYVPQDDIVLPELTVRENILHSARIRLPASWSDSEIQNHVDVLIACLQLSHVKHSLVGSPAAPVISGGQRKRVSIGMELAAAPMALFLDEPTSGLDATSASSIMSLLKALSRIGITIVAIIHQPRQEIYESLDEVILLGQGRMLFQGERTEVQPYFEQLGFTFPEHGNPADVIMDIIAGQGSIYKRIGETGIPALIDNWKNCQDAFAQRRPSSLSTISHKEMSTLRRSIWHRGAYWWTQIYFCFTRSILQQWRLKSNFFFEMGTATLAGFLGGLTENSNHGNIFKGNFKGPYVVLGAAIDYTSVPMMSLLVGLSMGLTAASPGVKLFGEEKLIYWREAASGHNKFAYYIGKVFSSLPRILLASLHFTVLFMLLATPVISWPDAFAANLLYYYTIYGLASVVSMLCRREDGPLLAVLASLIVGFLNGMSPSLATVMGWHVGWLWQASPGTWLAEGYFSQNLLPLGYLYEIDQAAAAAGYTLGRFSFDLAILFALGTAYRVLAFLGLVVVNRSKQK